MLPVRLHAEAEEELLERALSLEGSRADEFLDAFWAKAHDLAAYPKIGHVRRGVRQFRIARFRCSIVYLEHAHEIYVIAVAHHSRKPGYWRYRLR